MDLFHHRDQTGWGHHGYFPSAHFSPSHLQTDLWRSSPPAPRCSHSPPRPLPTTPRLNPVRNITPPEDKPTLGEEEYAVVKEFKSPYDRARGCVDRFKDWHSGTKIKHSS